MGPRTIPVKIHTPDAMFTETEGLIGIDRGRLVLEWETKDAIVGAYRSGVNDLEILPDDVASVTFTKGLLRAQLTIRARRKKTVAAVPGSKRGEIRLRFRRRHRAEAADLAAFLQDRLRELERAPAEADAERLE